MINIIINMVTAEYGNPFVTLKKTNSQTIDETELIRVIRYFVSAEYDAAGVYEQLAEQCADEKLAEAILDIADEEIVHAGEFLKMIDLLTGGNEFDTYKRGFDEVEENLGIDKSNKDENKTDEDVSKFYGNYHRI